MTVESYDPDTSQAQRVVAVPTDGGSTLTEIPLVRHHGIHQLGEVYAIGADLYKLTWTQGQP